MALRQCTAKVTNRASGVVIKVGGAAIAGLSSKLVGKLKKCFDGGAPVVLDVASVKEADITLLQIIWAARATAVECGVGFDVRGGEETALRQAREAGFMMPRAGNEQSWFSDGVQQ